jgi:signal transduction histidine kinase
MSQLKRRPRVLIVDDIKANLRLLAAALLADYDIETAADGAQALNSARTMRPDIVLLDIIMPGMDGYEVCRELKSNPATEKIPVIFLTSKGDVQDETHGFALGAVDYITKPFSLPIVQARLATHLVLAEQTAELAVALDRAEEADRLKSVFLATMSHELRTPLNSIIGFTGIMLMGLVGPLAPEQKKQLGMVQDSARHLLELINDVLDISKIEAGQIELAHHPFDMRTTIQKSIEKIAPLADKKGLAVTAVIAPPVDQFIGDRRRVEQILINLLSNAVKFTERGEVRIESQVEDGWLITRVIDTGIGIQPEDMDSLFKPFRQVDSGITRLNEGTGLGLSISKRLVELMGGSIQVESEWGKGSRFVFALQLERVPT